MDLSDLKKLKIREVQEQKPSPGQQVKAIVRVSEGGYVPPGVNVRSRIDDQIFTAEMPADRVPALREDARVVSVEVSHPLQKID